MVNDSGYIWDPWKRCPSPSVLTLNLPHEYKGHINEGLYPSRDGLPTIRTTVDKARFVFDFTEPEVEVPVEETQEQLTLF